MNKSKNKKSQDEQEWFYNPNKVKWLLITGLILVMVMPFLLTRTVIFDWLNFSTTGQIGDTIGGITSPIIGLLGAWFVYLSFRAQTKANEIQFNALRDQIDNNQSEKDLHLIFKFYDELKLDIRKAKLEIMGREKNYYDVLVDKFKKGTIFSFSGEPKLFEVFNALNFVNQQFDHLIKILYKAQVSDFDKDILGKKIIRLYHHNFGNDYSEILLSKGSEDSLLRFKKSIDRTNISLNGLEDYLKHHIDIEE